MFKRECNVYLGGKTWLVGHKNLTDKDPLVLSVQVKWVTKKEGCNSLDQLLGTVKSWWWRIPRTAEDHKNRDPPWITLAGLLTHLYAKNGDLPSIFLVENPGRCQGFLPVNKQWEGAVFSCCWESFWAGVKNNYATQFELKYSCMAHIPSQTMIPPRSKGGLTQ